MVKAIKKNVGELRTFGIYNSYYKDLCSKFDKEPSQIGSTPLRSETNLTEETCGGTLHLSIAGMSALANSLYVHRA